MATKKKEVVKKEENKSYRPPIVTIMGHVDHGKTSLLDVIRDTGKTITSTESGGITQHTGAYSIDRNGSKLVFIDTPGHEAFTEMRARGGSAADIVILVVAANDGVMPQTKEAIMHAKAANVPIIVAINKMDLPGADPNKVKGQLAENDLLVEDMGGDVVVVEVSAKEKTGIEDLLDMITLVSEVNKGALEIKPGFEGLVIEATEDKRKGKIVHIVVRSGTLQLKDKVIAGGKAKGTVKAMFDTNGKQVKVAESGDAVSILGFVELPTSGDLVQLEKDYVEKSDSNAESDSTEEVKSEEEEDKTKKLNIVVRADTVGTLEAVVGALKKLKVEDAAVNIVFSGVGDVKESDILLASTGGRGIVVGFKVSAPKSLYHVAKERKVIIRIHDIIYQLIEEIEAALEGVVEIEEAKIKGKGLVIQTFTLPKSNTKIAGTLVIAGKFRKNARVGVFRGEEDLVPLYIARIKSLHIGAKEVDVAEKGSECGIMFKPLLDDVSLDDRIEIL